MQGIYTYVPETNYVAAILLLLFMVPVSLVSMLKLLLLLCNSASYHLLLDIWKWQSNLLIPHPLKTTFHL